MSFDLSWLWQTLNAITDSLQSWFSSIWESVQNITNTGQGLFAGLANLGSSLWDAIIKAFQALGQAFVEAFNWIWQGLKSLGETLGGWLSVMGQWISAGIQWLGNALWSFGSWLYNAFAFIWNWVVNALTGVWNAITGFFSGIQSAIGGWWNAVVSAINAWFTNLVVGIRRKILQTIMVDVSIFFGWKSVERLINASSLKDAGFSIMGLLASPLVGFLFGSIANGLIPTPSTEPIQLIPSIPMLEYAPPPLTVERPTERIPPEMIPPSMPSPPIVGYTPIYDKTISLGSPTYQARWDAGIYKVLSAPAISYLVQQWREWYFGYDGFVQIYGSNIEAQTFTPRTTFDLSLIELLIGRVGSPMGWVYVEIYATDADGKPTGDPLFSKQIDPASIPYLTYLKIEVDPPLRVSAYTKYAIVVRYPSGNSSNRLEWAYGLASGSYGDYPRGTRVYSTNGGASWTVDNAKDLVFYLTGEIVG